MPLSLRLIDPPRPGLPAALRCPPVARRSAPPAGRRSDAPEPPLCTHWARLARRHAPGMPPMPTRRSATSCAAGNGPAALTALRVAAVYDGAVRTAILALTFQRQRRAAAAAGLAPRGADPTRRLATGCHSPVCRCTASAADGTATTRRISWRATALARFASPIAPICSCANATHVHSSASPSASATPTLWRLCTGPAARRRLPRWATHPARGRCRHHRQHPRRRCAAPRGPGTAPRPLPA